MDRGFETAQSLQLSAWTSPRIPPSARYAAANFAPGTTIAETVRVGQVVKAEPSPSVPAAAPPAPFRVATASPNTPVEAGGPAIGSWVIQVGSFNDSHAAELALERATSVLPDPIRAHGAASIDEVQMAQKTFHRARLTNLSQTEAIDGCKKLSQRKIYCSALQVTAWNTPGAH